MRVSGGLWGCLSAGHGEHWHSQTKTLKTHCPVDCGMPPGMHLQNSLQRAASHVAPRGFLQYPSRQMVKMGHTLSSQHSIGGGMGSQLVLVALATYPALHKRSHVPLAVQTAEPFMGMGQGAHEADR